jgi:hypothetical protein
MMGHILAALLATMPRLDAVEAPPTPDYDEPGDLFADAAPPRWLYSSGAPITHNPGTRAKRRWKRDRRRGHLRGRR